MVRMLKCRFILLASLLVLCVVQNNFVGLPGMDDGSVTVIDLEKEEVIASMDTLKKQGLNPNSIVLLPEWHHDAGH